MAFLKTCYVCGEKVEKLWNGKCEACFKEEHPPIVEIKPINSKYCNSCKKIHYQNQLISLEELIERLPDIVSKNLVIDEHYVLNDLKIDDLEIKGENVSFEVKVDCSLK